MKIVKVTYTTKAEYAPHNQENIKTVMADLRAIGNPGINYHCCLGADGKSFTHTAFFRSEEDEKVLLGLPSFIQFQQELKASTPETPPKQELLSLVGSSMDTFR
ncbi:MAG TPA: hypothetical protein VEW28_09735 [Candidatus Kapabacteria bacterium]|nr:hypothetical protein [Candidatus Kapabacteria bacterium]